MHPDVCYENITAPVRLMPQSTTEAHVPPGPQTHPALSQYNFSRSQVICKQIKDVQVLYHATCHVGIILFFRANGLEWNPWMNEWMKLTRPELPCEGLALRWYQRRQGPVSCSHFIRFVFQQIRKIKSCAGFLYVISRNLFFPEQD